MDRKKLMIAGGLIGLGMVFVMMVFIFSIFYIPFCMDSSEITLNSTNSYTENSVFDNMVPEEKALLVARLSQGAEGFNDYVTANASLSSDGKYWIVDMDDGIQKWTVTVDTKTWMSKRNSESWKSWDELRAVYIAEIQACSNNGGIGEPQKITMDGKEIWKVPVYYYHESDPVKTEYVYVDLATGKSKNELYDDTFSYYTAQTPAWLTLKEVDTILDKVKKEWPGTGPYGESPFKDALRDLYPE